MTDATFAAFIVDESGPFGKCEHCDEPLAAGERGFLVPRANGPCPKRSAFHRECWLRLACGSVGHQLRRCRCHGGNMEDPPGLTARQAARMAVSLMEGRRAVDQVVKDQLLAYLKTT